MATKDNVTTYTVEEINSIQPAIPNSSADNFSDAELTANATTDSDNPILNESFWEEAIQISPRPAKKQITVRLDADVLDWFKSQGPGYQTRMNAILKAYKNSHVAP